MAPERGQFSYVRVFFRFQQPHHDVPRLVSRMFLAQTQFGRPWKMEDESGIPEEARRCSFLALAAGISTPQGNILALPFNVGGE